ncbi:MAG: hypothetical protein AAB373_06060 [Patescibacteria group bacterium]
MDLNQNVPIVPERSKVLDVIYMLVFLGVIGYGIYVYGMNFDKYSEEELMQMSGKYYIGPAFLFSIVGLFTVKSEKSLLYAFLGAAVGGIGMVLLFEVFWDML